METVNEPLGAGAPPAGQTRDTLFGGRLVLYQPARGAGYRTNVDAILLAAFATACVKASGGKNRPSARPTPLAYDLGAGVGPVGLSLLRMGGAARVVLVEVDARAAAIAGRNAQANGSSDRCEVVCARAADVARDRPGVASLVVCNPPYFAPGHARASPSEARARIGDLSTFVSAARQLAGKRARVCFVYPAPDLPRLFAELGLRGLHPKTLRLVHASARQEARVALVEARPAKPGGLVVLSPLYERQDGRYTPEMKDLLDGAWIAAG